jgi:hypothetical protein
MLVEVRMGVTAPVAVIVQPMLEADDETRAEEALEEMRSRQ